MIKNEMNDKKKNEKSFLSKYKWTGFILAVMVILFIVNNDTGVKAAEIAGSNFLSMFKILPPILMLIGLLDAWVPKETMIKYMGPKSGVKGIFIALAIGSLAAGPLYAAFPVAAILIKKKARLAYVIFFLGVWSSTKLPLLMYEITSFGLTFTAIHVATNLSVFLIGSFAIEKMLSQEEHDDIYSAVAVMEN